MFRTCIACVLALATLAACGTAALAEAVKTTETWEISEEAQKKAELIQASGAKAELQKEYFDTVWPTLTGRPQDTLPEVQTEHVAVKETVLGSEVDSFIPENYDTIVLYVHGGAYIYGIDTMHVTYCDRLASALNAKVVMPLYPLAPDNTYEKTYELIDAVYASLLAEGKPIVIMGDSAGGGFSLAYTQYLTEKGVQRPDKVVLLSPWVDVTLSNPDIEEVNKRDITLDPYGAVIGAKAWAGTTPVEDYRISPLNGNLDSLPDTLIFLSTHELVYPDDLILYEKMTNTNVKLVIAKGLWHVFPISDIPEQQKSIDAIVAFVK